MDYISALIEECNNKVDLLGFGKIPEADIATMMLNFIALIKAKAENIEILEHSLERAKTDKEREVFLNQLEKKRKEKQQLEKFFSYLSERVEAWKAKAFYYGKK